MFSKFTVSYPRPYYLYRNVPRIQALPGIERSDSLRRYQEEFTIFHVTRYDVLATQFARTQRRYKTIKKQLQKKGVYSQFRFMDDWLLFRCFKSLPEFIMLCSFVASAFINSWKENTNEEGQLKNIQQIRQSGISACFNIPLLLQNLLTKLSENGVDVDVNEMVAAIKKQIKKQKFIVPNLFKLQMNVQLYQRQLNSIQFMVEKKNKILDTIADLTLSMHAQKGKMNNFMRPIIRNIRGESRVESRQESRRRRINENSVGRIPIISRHVARKSAPVETNVRKWRSEDLSELNEIQVQSHQINEDDDDNYNQIERNDDNYNQ